MFCIYKLTNPHNRGEYVGHTNNYERRMRQHRNDLTVECTDFEHEIVFDGIPSRDEAREMEKVFIDVYSTFDNGYNQNRGGGGLDKHTAKARQAMSEANLRRVEDGTHQFLGGEIQRRRVEDGTHNFLNSEFQERQREIVREIHRRRVEDGTHNLLGGEMQRRRVEDGTHNLLGGNIQREMNRRRVEDGTHQFLGGEITRETNRRRMEDGTHQFLGDSHPIRQLAKEGKHPMTIKRLKAEWMWIRSLARCWYEMNDYVMKRRQEFYNKDIPDTSQSTQLEMF